VNTLLRQIEHWLSAAENLANYKNLANDNAWKSLDVTTAKIMDNYLGKNIDDLVYSGKVLTAIIEKSNESNAKHLRGKVKKFKADYLKIESTIHFYTSALNTRANKDVGAILKGCDILAQNCLAAFLIPLKKIVPPVITYIDKGIGAAIMKAGLRLWDGSISPVALIKMTFHNLCRPTSLLHEAGHQIAHLLSWNTELAETLKQKLATKNPIVAKAFGKWSSEIAADAVAFSLTGFAAVAALHDVLDNDEDVVFHYDEFDPHPISFLRVLLNCAFCKIIFGNGTWDKMQQEWLQHFPISNDRTSTSIINASMPLLAEIAEIILHSPQVAFGNKSILQLINVNNAAPEVLGKLQAQLNNKTLTIESLNNIQLVALTGYKIGVGIYNNKQEISNMKQSLLRIGYSNSLIFSNN
jgi:hypothetical protein